MDIALVSFSYPNSGRQLKKLIQSLVQSGLVACAQVTNYAHSYFIREGKLKKYQEKLVVCKLLPEYISKVVSMIEKQHPYSIPEILIETKQCNNAYADRVSSCAVSKKK